MSPRKAIHRRCKFGRCKFALRAAPRAKLCAGLAFVLLALLTVGPTRAQLVLPGAAPPTPAGTVVTPTDRKPGPQKPKGAGATNDSKGDSAGLNEPGSATTRAPGEETVAGRQFQRHGSEGLMVFEKSAAGLAVGKLVLIGYKISRPAEFCRIEIAASNVALKPQSHYQGLLSYRVDMASCPFSLDVLDGAVRARGAMCAFTESDCKVDVAGIWGPPGDSIGPVEAASIEKLRGKADRDARAGFRSVLHTAGGDRNRVKEVARDQASFSSAREEACRDYAREEKHGFCASRVTLARAVALSAVLRGEATAVEDGEDGERLLTPVEPKKPRAPRKKTRLAAPAQATPRSQ